MALTFGLAAQTAQDLTSNFTPGGFAIQPVRVHFTFLDPEYVKINYPKLFELYGGYDTLGGILFESFSNPVVSTSETFEDKLINSYNFAKPLFPNQKQVPLLNEITYIISFPSIRSQDPRNVDLNQKDFYYFTPLNLWNTTHQNALPDPLAEFYKDNNPNPKNIEYKRAEAGAINNSGAQPPQINLGNTFVEKDNIKSLKPYEGDIIYEGRWGQSIRFGSTVLNQNPWSNTGTNGDPIFILRNGQAPTSTEAWVPTLENINEDLSSFYLTSTQQLPINVASSDYSSYISNPPTVPNQYNKNQIVLNSGRLLFNSTLDHILFSSNQSINLNAVDSVNIDTTDVIIQSSKIYLGDKDADEPLLLGNQTVDLLDQLIESLKALVTVCETLVSLPAGAPLAPLNAISVTVNQTLGLLQKNLQNIKSKDNFTV